MADEQADGKDGLGGKPRIARSGAPAHASENRRYVSVLSLALIAIIAVFYVSTIREGHNWGDDFALYVLHAKSIVEGKGYAETPYVHNDLFPDIGPKAYPPILPIALAPVYKWFGFNVTAMKIVVCVFFLAALWVLFWIYHLQLPWPYAAGLTLLLGFNPNFWDSKDEILSDFPFLFFVWVTLYAVQRHYDNRARDRFSGSVSYAILVGACMYLAYGTRVIGALLPASLFLYELVKFKKLSRFAVSTLLVAGILIAVQKWLLADVGGGYVQLGLLKYNTTGDIANLIFANIIVYIKGLPTFLDNGYSKVIRIALFVIVSLLAALGLRRRIKDGVTIVEVFLFLYLVVLAITPFQAFRYLIPIIPIYFFYACIGAIEMRLLVSGRGWQYAPIIVAGAVVLSYSSTFSTLDYGPIREGIGREESKELFQYIREHTELDEVIIFRKPRALALLTGRQASIYPIPSDNAASWDETTWKYFHDIGAHYLVVGATARARDHISVQYNEWERKFIERYKERFEEVFTNADFEVYKIKFDSIAGKLDLSSVRPTPFKERGWTLVAYGSYQDY